MKNMELAGPIERMPSTLINNMHSMPVRFTPARRWRLLIAQDSAGRLASGRGGTQAEALAKKRGKAQRDCNEAQQGERHIFDGVEPILCFWSSAPSTKSRPKAIRM